LQQFVASSCSPNEGDGAQACFQEFVPVAQERVQQNCFDPTAVSFGEAEGSTSPEDKVLIELS
jgi:hypothetical protein